MVSLDYNDYSNYFPDTSAIPSLINFLLSPPIDENQQLKPIRKRAIKVPVPEHLKDEKYYAQRAKNTAAAKLSRDRARQHRIIVEKKIQKTMEELNKENKKLLKEKKKLEEKLLNLKVLIINKLY
jgi:leukemia factor-related protein